jgi:glycosyltransferase involved in cell wall biosynthesis
MFKLTIITVVLNDEKKLEKTIKSVNSQTFSNFEHLVIDGGSIDKTKLLIKKNAKKNTKFIFKKDKGIYYAMNKGIQKAHGDWIFFLNAGDTFVNHRTLKTIFKNQSLKGDIFFGNIYKNYKYFKKKWISKKITKNDFLMTFGHQSVFVKKQLYKKYYFSNDYRIIGDFVFFYNLYKKNYMSHKIKLYITVIDTDGISNKKRILTLFETYLFFLKQKNFLIIIKILIYGIYILLTNFIKFFLTKKMIRYFQKK